MLVYFAIVVVQIRAQLGYHRTISQGYELRVDFVNPCPIYGALEPDLFEPIQCRSLIGQIQELTCFQTLAYVSYPESMIRH